MPTGSLYHRNLPILNPATGTKELQQSAIWTMSWTDHTKKRHSRSTRTTFKKTAEKLLAREIADAMALREDMPADDLFEADRARLRKVRTQPLTDHVTAYGEHLLLHCCKAHAQATERKLHRAAASMAWKTVRDITPATTEAYMGKIKRMGKANRTANAALTAIRAFCVWMVNHHGLPVNPVERHPKPLHAKTDVRRRRRSMSPEEVADLIRLTHTSPATRRRMDGPQRARLYQVAYGLGLRRGTLAELQFAHLHLSASVPHFKTAADENKNKDEHIGAISPSLAAVLQAMAKDQPKSAHLFPRLTTKTAQLLAADLFEARARWIAEAPTEEEKQAREKTDHLKYKDALGQYADFHAIRHTNSTHAIAAGHDAKTVRANTGHKDPKVFDRYNHTDLLRMQAAAAEVPPAEAIAQPPTTTP